MPSPPYLESLRKIYERNVEHELALHPPHHAMAIEPAQLGRLPAPVRSFVDASGCVARAHPSNARIVWRTMQLRSAPGASWLRVECEQVDFFREPARFALMRSFLGGLLPFAGYDRYCGARGSMFINVAGVLPLRRVYGANMDVSGLVTYLSEAMLLPVVFFDPRLQWTALDARSARASLRHGDCCVSGVFTFGPASEWVRFESDDRWRDGRVPRRQRWSAEVRSFAWHKGLRVPGRATAQWHSDQGVFTYMRGEIESVSYDVTDPRAMVAAHWSSLARASWRNLCCSSAQARVAPGGPDDLQEDTDRARLLGAR